MPPGSPMRGLVCRRATWTPRTISRRSAGSTRSTSPDLPLSRPLMATTLSPFLIFIFGMAQRIRSQHFGGERDDLHEPPRPEFAGDRPEDAGSDRLALLGDQYRRGAVEKKGAALRPPDLLRSAHDDGAMHIALLDAAARDRLLDRDDDDVADPGGPPLRAAQDLDALDPTCPRIVGDVEIGLHLDHLASPTASPAGEAAAAARRPGALSPGPDKTIQRLRFDNGRLSSIRTASPAW